MKNIIDWPIVKPQNKIMVVFHGGTGGNFLAYLIHNKILGLSENFKIDNDSNEYFSRSQYVYEQHLNLWFKTAPSDESNEMAVTKRRYNFVLENIKNNNMKSIIITNHDNMYYTDLLKLFKKCKQNNIAPDVNKLPSGPEVLQKHSAVIRHYDFLIKQFKKYDIDHTVLDYTDFFIKNNTEGLLSYLNSSVDISAEVNEYHEKNLELFAEYGVSPGC